MGTIIIIAQFILALAILVTLHELGHFLAARMFGIRVEKFYLFFDAFGFKLFKFKKGDTEYGIGWLPLGGYVKIAGMIDESLDSKQMATKPEAWEFRSKPAWQRLIVMVGGVVVNLILGLGIMITMIFVNGESYIPAKAINDKGGIYASPEAQKVGLHKGDKIIMLNGKKVDNLLREFADPSFLLAKKKEILLNRNGKDTTILLPENLEEYVGKKSSLEFIDAPYKFAVASVTAGSPASKAGLKEGDHILSINGKPSEVFMEFKELLQNHKDSVITIAVLGTDGKQRELKAHVTTEGTLGFMPKYRGFEGDEVKISYGLGESIVKGTESSFNLLGANIKALGKVVSGKVDARKTLAGPIGIAQMFGPTWEWVRFWGLTAMLSLVLAFMNILPIPALDGGHVMFLLWEIVTRRPVNEKVLYIGQIIGMLMLAALMVFIFWVDIARALGF
jgi:regulator of sigma E protease